YFTNYILAGTRDKFIKSHLYRELKTCSHTRYCTQGFAHRIGEFIEGRRRYPLVLWFQGDNDIGHLKRHRVCRYLACPDPCYNLFDFREATLKYSRGFL